MHEIKIYGEIIPFEDNWIIEQGGFSNLTDLQNQLKAANGSDIKVRINSCGGDCDTGFAMYAELRRYAKENKAKVQTFGEARVASIATVIFLAGDERILTEHTEPFVHNAWTYTMGDSKDIMRVAVDLQKYNEKIASHYANHTDLTKDEALALMEAETSITTAEAKEMRFCTAIEEVFRPAALQRFYKKNMESMSDVEFIDMMIPHHESAIKMANDFIDKVENEELKKIIENIKKTQANEIEEMKKIKEEIQNSGNNKQKEDMNKNPKTVSALAKAVAFIKSLGAVNKILYDATGVEIDFYELGEDEIAEVGAKARIDGKDADGSYVMTDGSTYVFVAGELTEIIAKAEDVNEEAVALQAEIDTLTAKLEEVTNASATTIENLQAENKKMTGIIANYKGAKSQDAPDDKKEHKKDDKKESATAKAVANFINRKPINTK